MTNTEPLVKISETVKFTPVVGSSLIASYARENNDLAIKLKAGQTYIYKSVDEDTFIGFVNAQSKGKYFGSSIKPNFIAEQAE